MKTDLFAFTNCRIDISMDQFYWHGYLLFPEWISYRVQEHWIRPIRVKAHIDKSSGIVITWRTAFFNCRCTWSKFLGIIYYEEQHCINAFCPFDSQQCHIHVWGYRLKIFAYHATHVSHMNTHVMILKYMYRFCKEPTAHFHNEYCLKHCKWTHVCKIPWDRQGYMYVHSIFICCSFRREPFK